MREIKYLQQALFRLLVYLGLLKAELKDESEVTNCYEAISGGICNLSEFLFCCDKAWDSQKLVVKAILALKVAAIIIKIVAVGRLYGRLFKNWLMMIKYLISKLLFYVRYAYNQIY